MSVYQRVLDYLICHVLFLWTTSASVRGKYVKIILILQNKTLKIHNLNLIQFIKSDFAFTINKVDMYTLKEMNCLKSIAKSYMIQN